MGMLCCLQVDGSVIGTTPLVPVNGSTATSFQQHLSRPGIVAPPHAPGHRFTSFASVGVSVFSFTFTAPSTPGTHSITAIAFASGTAIPVSAAVVSMLFR